MTATVKNVNKSSLTSYPNADEESKMLNPDDAPWGI
jgi:hypothetical protein